MEFLRYWPAKVPPDRGAAMGPIMVAIQHMLRQRDKPRHNNVRDGLQLGIHFAIGKHMLPVRRPLRLVSDMSVPCGVSRICGVTPAPVPLRAGGATIARAALASSALVGSSLAAALVVANPAMAQSVSARPQSVDAPAP
ncbi:MAG TPA: hypothetical protein VN222_12190, partial [Novosphingobium sp.]|nr:hypothetical protein [Novosphingobium sp.]